MPFTAYGFRLRSLAEVLDPLGRAGFSVDEDRRIGQGKQAFHLLVCRPIG